MDALALLCEFAYTEVTRPAFLDTTKFDHTLTRRGMAPLAQFPRSLCDAHLAIIPFSLIML